MDEWILIAKSAVPELQDALADDRSGTLGDRVVAVLRAMPGAVVPNDIGAMLASDPALRNRVSEEILALIETSKSSATAPSSTAMPSASDEVAAKLQRLDVAFDKLEKTRLLYLDLQARNAKGAWVNPALSVVITVGFIVLVYVTAFLKVEPENSAVFNIILGAFATSFATVIGFHFGSSVGSKDKDQDKRREAIEQASAGDAATLTKLSAT